MTSAIRPRIAIVDYGMGNRRSVEKALVHVGAAATITDDPDILRAADALVLPGVGAFPTAMANLRDRALDDLLHERVAADVPLLGICLGMQLLFDSSEEIARSSGLGLIPGTVKALAAPGLRVPHIGWSEVDFVRDSELTGPFEHVSRPFYHVHSFAVHAADESDVVGTTEYGERFTTIVARGNVYGVQFHPEKSSRDGLALLAAFTELGAHSRAGGARA